MNFDFTVEQQELRSQARRLLEARKTLAIDRRALEDREFRAEALWKEVADLGWLGAAIPERYDGLGLSRVFDCGLAEEFGRVLAPLPLESCVYAASEALLLAGSEEQKARWLTRIAEGRAIGTVAFCEGLGPLSSRPWRSEVREGRLSGVKVPVCDGEAADFAIVAARAEAGDALWLVELGDGVRRERLESIDPSRPLSRLTFEGARAERMPGTGEDAHETLARIVERAAVYTAFLQLGGAQAALEKTRDWALEREAFGRPIGGFQAVKHRLADLFSKIEIARSNAYYAAWALAADAPELPLAAAVARVSATTAFEQAARDMIHLHGALGVTWESDCQLYYRRSRHLALVFGAAQEWRERIMKALETRSAA
jgi:alkylation response protein AidB-like acyl-CoA dehydrogenase